MSTSIAAPDQGLPPLSELPRLLAAAPHRLLFFAGATAVIASMAWWSLWLIAARWGWAFPSAPIPAGWAHAISMQYHVLSLFIFGFLLTVFPRWMNLQPFTRWHYVPVAGGIFGGYLLSLWGLLGHPLALHAGVLATLSGWLLGVFMLGRLVWLDAARTWHAVSCWSALVLGAIGLGLFAGYLHTGDPRLAFAAIKFGTFGLLLPMFVTVCHRMIPFFSQSVLVGYVPYRPLRALAAFWVLVLIHLGLELIHGYAWLWLVDAPLMLLCGWLWWRWQPQRARPVRLLWALYLGFAWLPVAFALYAGQSAWFAWSGEFALGRAPVHALTVGFFGSLLVAMVTRVTQGHAGRPLEMGAVPWVCFLGVQAVTILRIGAETATDSGAWFAVAACAWVVAFLPWVLRSLWIYLTPRADGKPG